MLAEVIPQLVKKNIVEDKLESCPSLLTLCDKLINDLPYWSNRYAENAETKMKLANELRECQRNYAGAAEQGGPAVAGTN